MVDNTNRSKNQSSSNDTSVPNLTSSSDIDIDNRVNILVKNPEIILLENQNNSNSNCLVFNVRKNKFKNKNFLLIFS
jgi:hypothetical protein